MSSHSIGHDMFDHPRAGIVRVSTIAFDEPKESGVEGPMYNAETIVFVGPHTKARVGGMRRYSDIDYARTCHVGILKRAKRGTAL